MWWLIVLLMSALNTSGALEPPVPVYEPPPVAPEPAALKVIGIYGQRANTSSDLSVLLINVELPARAPPQDLTKLIIRYGDWMNIAHYAYGDARIDARAEHFALYWIRGDGTNAVAEAGDLIEIKLMPPADIAERTDVTLDLILETGARSSGHFRTPATYSTDTTITLR